MRAGAIQFFAIQATVIAMAILLQFREYFFS